MRALRWAVLIMGVLIVAGTVTLVTLLVMRSTGGPAASAMQHVLLDEPAGTRLGPASLSGAGDRVLVRLEGGGPDRLAVVDLRTGRILSRIALAR